jgi:hypothetical protein
MSAEDVCQAMFQGLGRDGFRRRRTGDALIQDVVRMEDIVEQLLAGVVEDQDFPL